MRRAFWAVLLASGRRRHTSLYSDSPSRRRPTICDKLFNSIPVWFCDPLARDCRKLHRTLYKTLPQQLVDRVVRRFGLDGILFALVQDRRGLGQLLPHQPRVDAALRASSSCDPPP